jgi:hypothetical protein
VERQRTPYVCLWFTQQLRVAIFSGLDIQKSTENRFKEGIIVYRASLFAGGNVTAYKGFLRVKKVAAPTAE